MPAQGARFATRSTQATFYLLATMLACACGGGGERVSTPTRTPPPSPEVESWISVVRLKDHEPGAPRTPITTDLEAIDFALSRPEVKAKITPRATWWGKAQKRAKEHPNRWFISFGQGDNACNTFYQCTLQAESDGSIVEPFACTEGWNCK